jgi:hypothetical protein
MLDEVHEHLEHLVFKLDRLSSTVKGIELCIEGIVTKDVNHHSTLFACQEITSCDLSLSLNSRISTCCNHNGS